MAANKTPKGNPKIRDRNIVGITTESRDATITKASEAVTSPGADVHMYAGAVEDPILTASVKPANYCIHILFKHDALDGNLQIMYNSY